MDQIKPMEVSTCANARRGSDERFSYRIGVAWRPLKNSDCVLNHNVISVRTRHVRGVLSLGLEWVATTGAGKALGKIPLNDLS
jgi:hypothetical protein